MISPFPEKNSKVSNIIHDENFFIFESEKGKTRISVYSDDIIRVSFTESQFNTEQGIEFNGPDKEVTYSFSEYEDRFEIITAINKCVINLNSGSVSFLRNNGEILFSETPEKSHILEAFDTYKTVGNIQVQEVVTPDGVKKRITSADKEYDKTLFHTRVNFNFQKNEKIFGLGQAEEGCWNLRGTTQYLNQANKKIAIPFLVSSLGYGLLFTTQSPAIFADTAYGSYFYTVADYYLDYFIIAPEKKNRIVACMRKLTGKALIPPKWAFGYVQSQERYETEKEILDTAAEFEKQNIPVSAIVLDWLSWEDGMWGQKSFDRKRFPKPSEMVDKLHEKDIHFMISIWPSMDEKCDNYKEMLENHTLLTGINICNAFEQKARELYWKQAREGLAIHGIESWWCDSSEPLTPEWSHFEKQPPEVLFNEYVSNCSDVMPIEKANSYGFYHALGMYEGQKNDYPDRRMLILTRNGYPGSQKLGVVLWSGDTYASWKELNNQLVAAIQFSLSGVPYWTFDIGGFFVKNGINWYWSGEYENTVNNPEYRELYTRWLQLGTFLPMFRAHGTDCRREPWAFKDDDNIFYDVICDFINLRYKLLPYIYSVAGHVWKDDDMFISPLFTNFSDEAVTDISTQFMFGPSLMICPVVSPMYYDKTGKQIDEKKTISVYLPGDCDWYDWWSGDYIKGGQWYEALADITKIPIFVKAGSIIPIAKDFEAKDKFSEIEFLRFPDKEGICDKLYFYEDAGESYRYIEGEYTIKEYI